MTKTCSTANVEWSIMLSCAQFFHACGLVESFQLNIIDAQSKVFKAPSTTQSGFCPCAILLSGDAV
jgi:hypothetical protein